jgi:hypothetical protein
MGEYSRGGIQGSDDAPAIIGDEYLLVGAKSAPR